MNAVHVTCQVFQAATIGIFLTLNTIAPVKSSKSDIEYNPEDTFKSIKTSIDSKVAENGHFRSYIPPDQPTAEFSQLQGSIDEEMSGLNFNFDQAGYDKFNLPQRQSVQPTFLLNYEPLRPSNFISAPPSRYSHYPFDAPEHQDDGGDGGDGDDGGDDGGDGGGGGGDGGGGNGGGGGGNGGGGGGNGGGGGGNGGGGGGNGGGGGGGSRNGGRFLGHQSFELDYDNYEPQNGWRPMHNKYASDISEDQYRNRPLLTKKVPGYGSNRVPVVSNSYQKPYKSRPVYKKKPSHQFSNDPYSNILAENKRPSKLFDDDTRPLRARGSNRRPLRVKGENKRLPYNNRDNRPASILDDDIEDDEPRPLQSRRFPTKKRQVCQKMSKSMTPNDIEDHDIIGRKMSCMVCKDLVTGGSYEKCSYKSDPFSEEYEQEPDVMSSFKINRFKRRIVDRKRKKPESGEEVEDYEYENINAQESEEDPEYVQNADAVADYDSEDPENYETAENESEEYKIPPLPTKSSTCRKVRKKGNLCHVCQDNLTNRQYEQCEYEEDPNNNAYDYSTHNVYGSPRYRRQLDSDQTYDDYFKKLFPELGSNRKSSITTKFSSKDGDFGFLDNGQIGFKKTKSSLLGDKDLSINFDSAEDESPVNKMLGEFRNKDRSNCKKSLKDKMTCYKCKDDKGSETEECMYITDNKPKERQQSYHETKKFNTSPETEKSTSLGVSTPSSAQQSSASSTLTHVYAPLYGSNYEPTAQHSYNRPQYRNRNYRLHKKPVTEEPVESVEEEDQSEAQSAEDYDYAEDPSSRQVSRHDLPDVDPYGPEGAYSEETVPVYDPTLRTWLPKYMVVKSSEEAMVDAELGFD